MKTIKIFLASSAELKVDREQFEIWIYRKCKDWVPNREIFLHLDIWEDFLDTMSATRLQDEYNKAIKNCDIFIMLFFTKVGKYTEEEFTTAFGQFKETNKPFIFTYFKDAQINMSEINDNVLSLLQFKKRLGELGHFFTVYKNIDDLKLQINNQLDKLYSNNFSKIDIDYKQIGENSKEIISNVITNNGIKNKLFQNISNSQVTDNSKETNIGNINYATFE